MHDVCTQALHDICKVNQYQINGHYLLTLTKMLSVNFGKIQNFRICTPLLLYMCINKYVYKVMLCCNHYLVLTSNSEATVMQSANNQPKDDRICQVESNYDFCIYTCVCVHTSMHMCMCVCEISDTCILTTLQITLKCTIFTQLCIDYCS